MTPFRASIIVSTWNGRHLLETCLPLLLRAVAQAGGGHEVIVVDDASTDDTVAYVTKEFPHVKLLALPRNLRFAGANNAAAKLATGDILVFLNNDMLVEPDFLIHLLRPFEDQDTFAVTAYLQMAPHMIGGGMVRETGLVRGRFENGSLLLLHEDPETEHPIPVIYAGGGSSAWRKDRFWELGGFDHLFRPFYFEDLDISYRGQKHGWRLFFAPLARMEHKHRQTNNPKYFPRAYIDRMFRKNNLLFLWKVLTDRDLVNAHFKSVWRMLMHPRTNPGFAGGFLRAAVQLPQLLLHRRRGRTGVILTDREVIARAAGKPRMHITDAGRIPYGSPGTGKRVLVVGFSPLPFEPERRVNGACHRTWQVVEALLQDGHQVTLIGSRVPDSYKGLRPSGLRFTGKNLLYFSLEQAVFEGSDTIQRICDMVRPEAIVAVHSYGAWTASQLHTDAPLWVDLNGYGVAEAQAYAAYSTDEGVMTDAWCWEKGALERADAISVVSTRQKFAAIGELAALGRLQGRNYGHDFIYYMPNAIEPVPYKHKRTVLRGRLVANDDFVVLWTGEYTPSTDVETLFTGLTMAMREDPRLIFVSLGGALPGKEATSLYHFRRLIEASEFAHRFIFTGWVQTEEIPNYYLESDLGINVDRPSYEALIGCRYRILEMLRAGLPVVTSLGTEISHIVRREKLGTTFSSGNAEGLVQAVLELARDESLRKRCGVRAREWVFKHRSYEQVMTPLRRWVQTPTRTHISVTPPVSTNAWQPHTLLGRFVRAWETRGLFRMLCIAARRTAEVGADLTAKALLARRGMAACGLQDASAPKNVLVIRAGSLATTGNVVQRLQARFPEVIITVLAPQSLVEETRFETGVSVIDAPGVGAVSYRLSRTLLRELRTPRFDTVMVAGEGNRRAEMLALWLRRAHKIGVRDDGAAHTFRIALYKPLLGMLGLIVSLLRGIGLSLIVGGVWGSIKLEGWVWRLQHRSERV